MTGHEIGKKLREKLIKAPLNITANIMAYIQGFFDGLCGKMGAMMIKQNDKRLHEQIRATGCNFRSLQAMAEVISGKILTAQQINKAYDDLTQNPKVLAKDCTCGPQLAQIILRAMHDLDYKGSAAQVGSIIDGNKGYWGGYSDHNFCVIHWNTKYPTGHFTLADKDGQEIFDPYDATLSGDLGKSSIRKILLYKVV